MQTCRKLFPLITIPYLAHVLGAAGWAQVAFVLSLSEMISLLIEFGFNLSATREISRHRHDRGQCSDVMAGVLGAQVLLALSGGAVMFALTSAIPELGARPWMAVFGFCYAIAQGFTPLWFFQGLERLAIAAGLEICGKILLVVGILAIVHAPEHATRVVALQAAATSISTLGGLFVATRTLRFRWPTPSLVAGAMRRGWQYVYDSAARRACTVREMFLSSGLYASPSVTGNFAIAEKISRATFGLLNPIRDAIFPRLSFLAVSSEAAAARLAQLGSFVMVGLGCLLSGGLLLFAPQLIHLVAGGSEFVESVTILRILSPLPIVLAVAYSVGLQWLLPLGRDVTVNRLIMGGGAINLLLAFLLAPAYGGIGMALSVLCAEAAVACGMVAVVLRTTSFTFALPRLRESRALISKAGERSLRRVLYIWRALRLKIWRSADAAAHAHLVARSRQPGSSRCYAWARPAAAISGAGAGISRFLARRKYFEAQHLEVPVLATALAFLVGTARSQLAAARRAGTLHDRRSRVIVGHAYDLPLDRFYAVGAAG